MLDEFFDYPLSKKLCIRNYQEVMKSLIQNNFGTNPYILVFLYAILQSARPTEIKIQNKNTHEILPLFFVFFIPLYPICTK
jgi:hypothetical protein